MTRLPEGEKLDGALVDVGRTPRPALTIRLLEAEMAMLTQML
jgi:hypothetical protein